jgi:O-antigen/teichoic acid export membrane protein
MIKYFNKISGLNSANKIAVNSIIVYGQRFFAAALSLITTPIILNALGVEDYGLYSLTIGLVALLAFVNWGLAGATQRYIAFALGAGDKERLRRIFASSLLIQALYAVVPFLIIASFSGLIVNRFLDIPEARIDTAQTILVFVSIITFFTIVSAPFQGLYRAHENFLYPAIIVIFESLFKLGIAISLIFVDFDKLITYSFLLLVISFSIFIVNLIVCKKLYQEVNFRKENFDKILIIEMLAFTGWNLLGAIASVSRGQGVSILLNIFFGVVVNAAYGIAMQVNTAIGMLSQGMSSSMGPQIIKSAGIGDYDKMTYLMRTLCKFSVISVSILAIPFVIEAPIILEMWLKVVPEGAIIFSQLTIIYAMIMGLSSGIQTVFKAIGKVKLYNIYVSLTLTLNLPISYVLFKMGYPAYTTILVGIFLEVVSFFIRLYLLRKYIDFSVYDFLRDVILKIAYPIIISVSVVLLLNQISLNNFMQLLVTFSFMFSFYPYILFKLSLDQKQKDFVLGLISKIRLSTNKK